MELVFGAWACDVVDQERLTLLRRQSFCGFSEDGVGMGLKAVCPRAMTFPPTPVLLVDPGIDEGLDSI